MIEILRRFFLMIAVISGLMVHFNDAKSKRVAGGTPILFVGKNGLPNGIEIPFDKAIRALPPNLKEKIRMASVRLIADFPWYQFLIEGELCPRYISALTGKEGPNEDEVYADEIARNYLDRNGLKQVQLLTRFNEEYLPINRILPVYRFDAEDLEGNRVYVSTAAGKVVFHKNNGASRSVLVLAK